MSLAFLVSMTEGSSLYKTVVSDGRLIWSDVNKISGGWSSRESSGVTGLRFLKSSSVFDPFRFPPKSGFRDSLYVFLSFGLWGSLGSNEIYSIRDVVFSFKKFKDC